MNAERSGDSEEYHPAESLPDPVGVPGPRRRSRLRQFGDRRLPDVARWLIGLLWKTCRVHIEDQSAVDALLQARQPIIPCYWHGQQIFCVHALLELRRRHPELCLGYLISPSRDGDAAARVFADLDLRIIRGSASRGGARALRDIYQAIRRENVSPIVTPDGPRGPSQVFKSGVVMLASLSGAPLVPIACAARPAIRLSSWDRTLLPLPFARVRVVVGQPMNLPRGLAGEQLDQACKAAGAALGALEQHASDALDP